MKRDTASFVAKCMIRQQVKVEHQKPPGLLWPLEIPEWKWDKITMDFVIGLLTTFSKHNAIWVIVDQLTKSAYFISIKTNFSLAKLSKLYIREVVKLHGIPSSIVSDRDPYLLPDFGLVCRKPWAPCWILVSLIILRQMGNQRGPSRL